MVGQRAVRLHPVRRAGQHGGGLQELERELDSERMRSQLVVALEPMSRIPTTVTRAVADPRRMLIFDPRSGDNLTLDIER